MSNGTLQRQPLFFALLAGLFVAGLSCIAAIPVKELFIRLNFFHSHSLNLFFTNYTLLGDGVVSIALCLLLLLMGRLTLATQVISTYMLSGIVARLLKVALPAPRPKALFSPDEYAWFIDGVTYAGNNSFPSGHTASAFALATIFCLHSPNKTHGIIYFLLALIVGYSRIYLGQHFLQDVLAGALIGVLSSLFIYWYIQNVDIRKSEQSNTARRLSIQLQ